jgi:hypothetical protein
MLTKFKKLDAVLVSKPTYDRQDTKKLVALAEVQISGSTEPATLVLVTRADISESQKNQLLQGYQKLLMSTEGLELLEQYAKGLVGPGMRVTALPETLLQAAMTGASLGPTYQWAQPSRQL